MDEVILKIIRQCLDSPDISEWENTFLDSLEQQVLEGKDLSPKQKRKLIEIDDKT